ncbi:MAG: YbgC/FadM family acyl-CoA thioesterase [Alphaproteobacteria bacterium]|nr:YbgC/FadM family acyl-CoA thioesterase [Alphaproteobacteria bacterium]
MADIIAPLSYETRISYADTDAGGIIYHARYIEMAERARLDMLRRLGCAAATLIEQHGGLFVVKKLTIDYLQSAGLDSDIIIETQPKHIGGSSLLFAQHFYHQRGTEKIPLASLEILLVFVAYKSRKATRIPTSLRQLFYRS